MRVSILSICLALALLLPAWGQTSSESALEWPELMNYLDEIGNAFLSVTESSDAESERLRQERLDLQSEKVASEQERSEIENEKQSLSDERRLLQEDKKRLAEREILYGDIQEDLQKANKRLKRARVGGLIAVLGAAALGGVAGWILHGN